MTSPDIHTLTGAYAASALTDEERDLFEAHLAECADCAQEVAELLETTAMLGAAAATPAPPALFDRVMAEVSRTRQVPPLLPAGSPSAARTRWERRMRRWALTAAACLAALVVGVGALAVQGYREARENQRLTDQIAAVLAAPDAQTVTVSSNGSSATAVVSRQRSEIVFVARGLPGAPPDRTYQAWMIGPSGARSAGLLGPAGRTPLILRDPAGVTSLGVTVEPARGSTQPTSDPVLLLELPKA
jgi:anti-sigma-K factor RskA